MTTAEIIKDVERWSLRYSLIRYYVDLVHSYLFYENHVVEGFENIPLGEPIIFAANHQNALMDAMAVLSAKHWQPVFLARADIFKKPTIAKILKLFKIMPIYRKRDNVDTIAYNEEIFIKSVDIVKKRRILIIFPEASHVGKRILRPLRKGLARIAFQAQDELKDTTVNVIPIGINYSTYFHMRSTVQVNFGQPVKMNIFMEEFKQNQAKAIANFLDTLSEAMKNLIIDIKDDEFYDTTDKLRKIYDFRLSRKLGYKTLVLPNKIKTDQIFLNHFNQYRASYHEELVELKTKTNDYFYELKQAGLNDWLFDKPRTFMKNLLHSIIMILLAPLFIYGAILNFIPFRIPGLITKKIKDRNFHTSFYFATAIVIFPIYYFALFSIAWIVEPVIWFKYALLVSLPAAGVIAYHYSISIVKLFLKWKVYIRKNNSSLITLKAKRNEIISILDKICT